MNILISAYTGMGNMVLKTPMIRSIYQLFNEVKVDLVAGSSFGPETVLANSNYINDVFLMQENNPARNKNIIKNWQYDYCFVGFDAAPQFLMQLLRSSNINTIIRHYLPSKNPINKAKRVAQKNTIWVPLQAGRHEIDLNFDLLEAAYGSPFKRKKNTFVAFKEDNSIIKKYEIIPPYFIIQPGAANGIDNTKIWPSTSYIELIELLLKNYGHQIVLVGHKKDYDYAVLPIATHFENDSRVVNTAGATEINELKNLLYYSKLIICHDSGVMHLGDALEKPLIALFGPSDFSRVKPLKPTSHYLFSKTKYLNIKYNFKSFNVSNLKKNEAQNYPMQGLPVEEVFNKVKSLI